MYLCQQRASGASEKYIENISKIIFWASSNLAVDGTELYHKNGARYLDTWKIFHKKWYFVPCPIWPWLAHNTQVEEDGIDQISQHCPHHHRHHLHLREEPCKKNACSNGILPDSVSTPSSKRTLCGRYFSPKMDIFFKTAILTLGMDILTIAVVKHDS